jgi:hypothetical protein
MEPNIKTETYQIAFTKGMDAIDVNIYPEEAWIELKIQTTESFPITSVEELDIIYKKLRKILKKIKPKKNKYGSQEDPGLSLHKTNIEFANI